MAGVATLPVRRVRAQGHEKWQPWSNAVDDAHALLVVGDVDVHMHAASHALTSELAVLVLDRAIARFRSEGTVVRREDWSRHRHRPGRNGGGGATDRVASVADPAAKVVGS